MEEIKHNNNQLNKRKNKQTSELPKLNKVQLTPIQPKIITRGMGKKYCAESIFKAKQQKRQKPQLKCLKIGIQQDWIIKSKQYKQIQIQMTQCRRKHHQDMINLDKAKQQKQKDIIDGKKQIYDLKLSLWQMKNQIFELSTAMKDQQEEYQKLLNQLGYQQGDDQQLQYQNIDNNNQQQEYIYTQLNNQGEQNKLFDQSLQNNRNHIYSNNTFRQQSFEQNQS